MGYEQRMSQAESVDSMPAAAGKGYSSQPQPISMAYPIFWLGPVKETFMSFGTPVGKTSLVEAQLIPVLKSHNGYYTGNKDTELVFDHF